MSAPAPKHAESDETQLEALCVDQDYFLKDVLGGSGNLGGPTGAAVMFSSLGNRLSTPLGQHQQRSVLTTARTKAGGRAAYRISRISSTGSEGQVQGHKLNEQEGQARGDVHHALLLQRSAAATYYNNSEAQQGGGFMTRRSEGREETRQRAPASPPPPPLATSINVSFSPRYKGRRHLTVGDDVYHHSHFAVPSVDKAVLGEHSKMSPDIQGQGRPFRYGGYGNSDCDSERPMNKPSRSALPSAHGTRETEQPFHHVNRFAAPLHASSALSASILASASASSLSSPLSSRQQISISQTPCCFHRHDLSGPTQDFPVYARPDNSMTSQGMTPFTERGTATPKVFHEASVSPTSTDRDMLDFSALDRSTGSTPHGAPSDNPHDFIANNVGYSTHSSGSSVVSNSSSNTRIVQTTAKRGAGAGARVANEGITVGWSARRAPPGFMVETEVRFGKGTDLSAASTTKPRRSVVSDFQIDAEPAMANSSSAAVGVIARTAKALSRSSQPQPQTQLHYPTYFGHGGELWQDSARMHWDREDGLKISSSPSAAAVQAGTHSGSWGYETSARTVTTRHVQPWSEDREKLLRKRKGT